ncbi:hypothetical protein SY83_17465 [Paenibacillus swuensis]|uniref:Copper amine oxidase n=1 Tax=Paenibacillus swuensis TaxID=1178515 RepID=A0A172TPJ1_9BACL|nr:hypothetical protein SY83_17465 [Paenibacillus swuensis]
MKWDSITGIIWINRGQATLESTVQAPKPVATGSKPSVSLMGIEVGDSIETVTTRLGAPVRKDPSEYGFTWYIYHNKYKNYIQVGISNGIAVALYTNANGWTLKNNITVGTSKRDAEQQMGAPVTSIMKNNVKYILNDNEHIGRYRLGANYVTLFYDKYTQNRVTSVLVVQAKAEESLVQHHGSELISAYEQQSFDIANALRVRLGKTPFIWDKSVSSTARKHSADMIVNRYFDHSSPSGTSPLDRMKTDGIIFQSAAENIAAGQQNAIYAHEAWMNSEGHRTNLMSDNTRLGVGVSFGGKMNVYYTQNFFTPYK